MFIALLWRSLAVIYMCGHKNVGLNDQLIRDMIGGFGVCATSLLFQLLYIVR